MIWRFWKRNHRKFLTVRSLPTLSSRLENTLLHHLPGSKKNVNFWYWLALLLALTFLDFRFTIPPTVDKMSSNKFDALGSDDSEGEGDPGQTLVEVDWLKKVFLNSTSPFKLEKGAFTPLPIPEGEHRLQSQYCLWYRWTSTFAYGTGKYMTIPFM